MPLSSSTLAYLDMLRWLRRCRPVWTQFHLRCVAIRAQDGWRATWTEVVLTDADRDAALEPAPPGLPNDIMVISASRPIEGLPRLLRSIRAGQLPSEMCGEPIRLSWKAESMVHVTQFLIQDSPQTWGNRRDLPPARWWAAFPHGALEFDVGGISDWTSAVQGRHSWFYGLDGRARRAGCRGFIDLGARLGFLDEPRNANSISSLVPFVRLVAPYLVRIARASFSRETAQLHVLIERSRSVADRPLAATLVEEERSGSPRAPIAVPTGCRGVKAVFDDVAAGHAEVRLHDDVLDTFSARQGHVRGRYRRSVRSAVAQLFGEIEPLRKRLIESHGRDLEAPIKELLELVGLPTKPIDRVVAKNLGLPDGVGDFNLLAEAPGKPLLVAVECSSGWCGPEKLGKIVARANELSRLLRERVAKEELSCVQPALAVNKKRELAAGHLLKSARQYGVGVFALEDMLELLDMVAAGEPPGRIGRRLADCLPSGSPPLLRPLADQLGVYEQWDDDESEDDDSV